MKLIEPLLLKKKAMAHFRTEEDMFPLIEQWQSSDQLQKVFCAERDISVSVFAYWLRRYRDQQNRSDDQEAGFIPVRCDPVRMSVPDCAALEVALPSGAVLRFAQVVPLSYLKALL